MPPLIEFVLYSVFGLTMLLTIRLGAPQVREFRRRTGEDNLLTRLTGFNLHSLPVQPKPKRPAAALASRAAIAKKPAKSRTRARELDPTEL